MTSQELEPALRSMIRRYGFEQVYHCLQEIGLSEDQRRRSSLNGEPYDTSIPTQPAKRRSKISATEYVSKLDLPLEKKLVVAEMAKRFQGKSFLPTFGDIANFCQIHGLKTPASKTRASAVPRVFKFIATMDPPRIREILDDGMYSGPSKLGPIADAIRNNGRASVSPGF